MLPTKFKFWKVFCPYETCLVSMSLLEHKEVKVLVILLCTKHAFNILRHLVNKFNNLTKWTRLFKNYIDLNHDSNGHEF